MNINKLLVILLSFFISISVTACRNKSANREKEVKKPEAVNLNIFIGQPRLRNQYEKYLNQFVKKYYKENNIKISYNLEMPDPTSAPQILKTKLASNENIDIFSIHAINDIPLFYKAGYLEDLSSEPFVDKLYNSIKHDVTIDGKVVGVPLESLFWGILYNKSIFKKLNLKPALTINDMKKNITKLKRAGITPFLLTYKEPSIPQLLLPLTAGALINTKFPDFIDRMNKDNGSFKELYEMFNIIDLVNSHGTGNPFDFGGTDGCKLFASGKAAMWVEGTWYADTILKDNPDFKIGVAPLPVNNNPDASMINIAVSTTLSVSAFSTHKKEAISFINYILDDKDSSNFYQDLKFNPVAKMHNFKIYPWVKEAETYIKKGKCYHDPAIPAVVKDEAGKILQSYFAEAASKEDVIKVLDKTWKSYNITNK